MALDRAEIVNQTVAQFSGDAEVLNNRIGVGWRWRSRRR
jgi:hypothetical protein